MKLPLTVHVGFDRLGPRATQPTFEYPGVSPDILAKIGPRKLVEWVALPFLGTAPSMSFAQLILSGVFDRFPDLKIFFAETRLGWVPFWMEEADYWYERPPPLGRAAPELQAAQAAAQRVRAPSTSSSACSTWSAWRSSSGTTWASSASCSRRDFPHIECDWPNTRPFAERLFAGVPADEAFKIAGGQHARLLPPRGHADGQESARAGKRSPRSARGATGPASSAGPGAG